MKFPGYFTTAATVLVVCAFTANASASEFIRCSDEDNKYAERLGGNYEPRNAVRIGLKIQEIVRSKDTTALFSHVEGELRTGPRKKFALSKPFDEIFPEGWVAAVLEDAPSCSPLGYRGFMFGNGELWYTVEEDSFRIVAINGASEEQQEPQNPWKTENQTISPRCLSYPWPSGDNFEAIAEHFGIADESDFLSEPGKYLGDPVNDLAPVRPPWCYGADCNQTGLSVAQAVDDCNLGVSQVVITREEVIFENLNAYDEPCSESYTAFGRISPEACSALAPAFQAACKGGAIIRRGRDCAAGNRAPGLFGIYGLFELTNSSEYIIPLRFFATKNDLLNFLHEQPVERDDRARAASY
jgi:hypothetical protein